MLLEWGKNLFCSYWVTGGKGHIEEASNPKGVLLFACLFVLAANRIHISQEVSQ